MFKRRKPRDPEVIADASRLAQAGADCETILVFLRDRGFDKIDSTDTVQELYGLSLAEAKHLVHHSAAWSDRFYSDMKLRETAMRALRDLAASKDPSLPSIELPEPDESES